MERVLFLDPVGGIARPVSPSSRSAIAPSHAGTGTACQSCR